MEKKVYENNIENAQKFLNNGMHKETDRNELVENVCLASILSTRTLKKETEKVKKLMKTKK